MYRFHGIRLYISIIRDNIIRGSNFFIERNLRVYLFIGFVLQMQKLRSRDCKWLFHLEKSLQKRQQISADSKPLDWLPFLLTWKNLPSQFSMAKPYPLNLIFFSSLCCAGNCSTLTPFSYEDWKRIQFSILLLFSSHMSSGCQKSPVCETWNEMPGCYFWLT